MLIQILDDGAVRFVKPDGESFDGIAPEHGRPLADWTHLVATHREQALHIDEKTAVTRWCGETLDYGMAIEGLLDLARRARDVSAETSGVAGAK